MLRRHRLRWILFWIYAAWTAIGTYCWGSNAPDWFTWPWVILLIVLLAWKILELISPKPPANPPPTA